MEEKPIEVIMRIDFASSNDEEIVIHAERVIELVRCKDCKHKDAKNGLCEGRGWPMQLVPDDGFCDKGERSENERAD